MRLWGFHIVWGGFDPEEPFRPRFVGGVDIEKGYLIGGFDPILPGCDWFHEP